jgi:GNAT superfamily N-acetyltransferase
MGHNATGIPAKLRLSFDAAPSAETRGALGYEIHAFHAQTVPYDAQRFALLLHDAANRLVAGLSGVLSWQWLFVEALWVGDTWRGRGIGRALLTQPKRTRWLQVVTRPGSTHSRRAVSTWRWATSSSAP